MVGASLVLVERQFNILSQRILSHFVIELSLCKYVDVYVRW